MPKEKKPNHDAIIRSAFEYPIVDILFSAKLGTEDVSGYLFLLLEYQSTTDYYMVFRLFKYMLNIA